MNILLEEFFYRQRRKILASASIHRLEKEKELYKKQLNKSLNKKQKELLLKIEDVENLIIEESGFDSFIVGFQTGLTIGYEASKN